MRFIVLVAADLYNAKVNLELSFPTVPSMSELQRQVETTFAVESSVLRPPGQPYIPFKVTRFQLFDDRLQTWVDLISSSQLTELCQVYAFQRDQPEIQAQIPPARLPSAARAAVSPRRQGSAAPVTPIRSSSPTRTPGAYSSTSYTSAVNTSTTISAGATGRAFPENPGYDTKVRVVFEELDVNNNRVIELDEFRRALRVLNIEFTAATVSDLFGRGDADRDGVISMVEWQHFAVNYPSLIDSLYFRSKEFWETQRKNQAIEAQTQNLEGAKVKSDQARALHSEAQRDLDNQERQLSLQEQELQAKLVRERECRSSVLDAKKETERAQFERGERERDLAGGRDRERQRHQAVAEAQRGTEGASRRVAAQEAEFARAQEKERQLEALLAEARRETERQLNALQISNQELSQWREREQQSLSIFADAQREVQRLQDAVQQADIELARRVEKERDADAILAESQRDTARASHRRDEEERALQLAREREAHHARLEQDAFRNVEDTERLLRNMEHEHADYLARRKQIEAQEMPILEQEVRLREQRFSLEEKETQLRTEAASFSTTVGRSPVPIIPTGSGSYIRGSPHRSPPRRL